MTVRRLHWGCGAKPVAGWINSDRLPGPGINIARDIRTGLPLPDDWLDYAVGIHALQDVPYLDLLPVVRDTVYHPAFRGSFSLKYVLTPLVPELTYDDLVIVDGRVASVEIARLLFVADRIPRGERDRVRRDLLAYCKQDTWAMVRLLEELRKLA